MNIFIRVYASASKYQCRATDNKGMLHFCARISYEFIELINIYAIHPEFP